MILARCVLTISLLAGGSLHAVADTLTVAVGHDPAPSVSVTGPETMIVSVQELKSPLSVSPPKGGVPDAVWGLGGVALGFLLGEGARALRAWRRIRRLKTALRDECRSLLGQIPSLIDICGQMQTALGKRSYMAGPAVGGIRTIYMANISELAPHLTQLERNLLHVVHERMRVADNLIATHASELVAALADGHLVDPWGSWIGRVGEVIKSYGVVQELVRSYLDGSPIDVFHVDERGRGGEEPEPVSVTDRNDK